MKRNSHTPNEFIIKGKICRIKLYDRQLNCVGETIIDVEDVNKCIGYKWCLTRRENCPYVRTNPTSFYPAMALHRQVMGIVNISKITLDHINRDTLANRKSNLRVCTQSQNGANQKIPKNNRSGYKGVYWHKYKKKWVASVRHNFKLIEIGLFINKMEAVAAYRNKAKQLFGEFYYQG